MSRHLRSLDDLFETFDQLEAETLRQRQEYDTLDDLLLSEPTPLDSQDN